jgi:hypothetical protein
MDWASIILPITPPDELAVPIKIGESPSCWAVIFCRPPYPVWLTRCPVARAIIVSPAGQKKGRATERQRGLSLSL